MSNNLFIPSTGNAITAAAGVGKIVALGSGSRKTITTPGLWCGFGDIDASFNFTAYKLMDDAGVIPLERLTLVTAQIGDISTALTAILGE